MARTVENVSDELKNQPHQSEGVRVLEGVCTCGCGAQPEPCTCGCSCCIPGQAELAREIAELEAVNGPAVREAEVVARAADERAKGQA